MRCPIQVDKVGRGWQPEPRSPGHLIHRAIEGGDRVLQVGEPVFGVADRVRLNIGLVRRSIGRVGRPFAGVARRGLRCDRDGKSCWHRSWQSSESNEVPMIFLTIAENRAVSEIDRFLKSARGSEVKGIRRSLLVP